MNYDKASAEIDSDKPFYPNSEEQNKSINLMSPYSELISPNKTVNNDDILGNQMNSEYEDGSKDGVKFTELSELEHQENDQECSRNLDIENICDNDEDADLSDDSTFINKQAETTLTSLMEHSKYGYGYDDDVDMT